jgi:hypothetical protein
MIYTNATAVPRVELTDKVMESVTSDGMFIGAEVLPPAPLRMPSGHYPKITVAEGDLMRAAQTQRAPGTGFVRSQAGVGDGTVNLVQYGEELQIPDETEMLYEDYFSLEQTYSIEGRNKLLRLVEILVQGQIQNTTNFDSVNSAVAYTTANVATSSFIADIDDAIARVSARGENADTIVMSAAVYSRIRASTLVKAYIAGANNPGSIVNANTIQRAFAEMGITKVLIGRAYVNQSINNDRTIINPIWNNTHVWVGSTGPTGIAGNTFYWEKFGPLLGVETYRDEVKMSNIIRVKSTLQAAIKNVRAGTLVATQYS